MLKSLDDYKILIYNSAIIIQDYTWGSCPTLENQFCNWNPITHSREYIGIYYDKEHRKLHLPRGIDVSYVKRKIQSNSEEDPTSTILHGYDYGYSKYQIKMKMAPRDNVQMEALKFVLCKDQYQSNNSKSQFCLALNTGAGKTFVCACLISYLGVKTIIITSQSGILDQWKERLMQYTDIREDEIVKIEGGPMISRILNGTTTISNKSVYLCTHSTLQTYGSQHGWDKVGELLNTLGIGIKIFDEAHQNFNNMALIDFATKNIWKTYYVTATPARSDRREDQIYKLYMRNVPAIDLFDPENDPHTKYIAIKYNSYPKPSEIIACKTSVYGLSNPLYVDYLMKNDRFWIMFDYIFNLIYRTGGRALFYIATNSAILKVKERILMHYPELEFDVGIYSSANENKQEAKNRKYILTTTKSAGAGEDIKDLKYSVVLAEPFKSEVLARQTLGRTRDKDTTYIELVDLGFQQIVSYYNAKKHIFSKYATECKNYPVDNPTLMNIREEVRVNIRERFSNPVEYNTKRIEGVQFIDKNSIPGVYFIDNSINNQ